MSLVSLIYFFSSLMTLLHGCIPPTGLGTDPGSIDPSSFSITGASWSAQFAANSIVRLNYEPTIEFRALEWTYIAVYNSYAMYDEIAIDAFGRTNISESRRRCLDTLSEEDLQLHKDVAALYTYYYMNREIYQSLEVRELADQALNDTGLDPNICEGGCDDISTPWGLSYLVAQEMLDYAYYDGYNADGSYNREFNRIPFQDWRDDNNRYVPRNDPWRLRNRNLWQPLLESDNIGFLFNQEFVTPHIGFTGRLMYLSPDYFCSLSLDDPNYNYREESELLFARMRNLTDTKKAAIEIFDKKFASVAQLFDTYASTVQPQRQSTAYWNSLIALLDVVYEASLIAWRQKALLDRVRPPSIIHELFEDEEITTYAGTTIFGDSQGVQTMLGQDFESYIRTMPHPEYPSGSSCLCEAVAEVSRTYWGFDDFLTEPTLGYALNLIWRQGSSDVENNVPAEDVTLEITSWSQMSEICGQSRLDGGMHFTASVPDGAELCRDAGRRVAEATLSVLNGEVPDYVADFNDREIKQDICDNGNNGKGKGKGNSP